MFHPKNLWVQLLFLICILQCFSFSIFGQKLRPKQKEIDYYFFRNAVEKNYSVYFVKDNKFYRYHNGLVHAKRQEDFLDVTKDVSESSGSLAQLPELLRQAKQEGFTPYVKNRSKIFQVRGTNYFINRNVNRRKNVYNAIRRKYAIFSKKLSKVTLLKNNKFEEVDMYEFFNEDQESKEKLHEVDMEAIDEEINDKIGSEESVYARKGNKYYVLERDVFVRLNLRQKNSLQNQFMDDPPAFFEMRLLEFQTSMNAAAVEVNPGQRTMLFEVDWTPFFFFSPNFALKGELGVTLIPEVTKGIIPAVNLATNLFLMLVPLYAELGIGVTKLGPFSGYDNVFQIGAGIYWSPIPFTDRLYIQYSVLSFRREINQIKIGTGIRF